jgi:hypothetical protein
VSFGAFGSIARPVGALAFMLVASTVLLRGRLARVHFTFKAGMAYVGILLLSVSISGGDVQLSTYLGLLALSWLTFEAARLSRSATVGVRAYVAGCLVLAAGGLLGAATGTSVETYEARFALGGVDLNEAGVLLAIGLAAVPLGAFRGVLRGAISTFLATGIVLSGSRGAALAALPIVVIPMLRPGVRPLRRLALFAAALGVIVIVSLFALADAPLARIYTIMDEVAGGDLGQRRPIWDVAVESIRSRPLLGGGPDALRVLTLDALGRERVAHNTLLSVAAEAGFIGLAAFLAMVYQPLWRARKWADEGFWSWATVFAVLTVGSLSLSWQYDKIVWFLPALMAAYIGRREWTDTVRRGLTPSVSGVSRTGPDGES